MDDSEYPFPRGTNGSFTPYVLRSIAVPPQPGWFEETFEEAKNVRRLAAVAAGVNECQGAPCSEELDGKELHGALGDDYDLESRGSVFFLCFSSRRQHINSTSIYGRGIMLILGGGVYCMSFSPIVRLFSDFVSFLANCALVHTDKTSDTSKEICIS